MNSKESVIANVLVSTVLFSVFRVYGFEATVVVALVLIVMALGDVAMQLRSNEVTP